MSHGVGRWDAGSYHAGSHGAGSFRAGSLVLQYRSPALGLDHDPTDRRANKCRRAGIGSAEKAAVSPLAEWARRQAPLNRGGGGHVAQRSPRSRRASYPAGTPLAFAHRGAASRHRHPLIKLLSSGVVVAPSPRGLLRSCARLLRTPISNRDLSRPAIFAGFFFGRPARQLPRTAGPGRSPQAGGYNSRRIVECTPTSIQDPSAPSL